MRADYLPRLTERPGWEGGESSLGVAEMATRASLATAHLMLRLRPLNRGLRAAVERRNAATARLARSDLSALCVTEDHVHILLDELDRVVPATPVVALLSPEEQRAETTLRERSRNLGSELPLDRLTARFELNAFEQEALLLCAAPELDCSYERIYGFILDDLNRRFPCVELLCSLTASSIEERVARRHAFGLEGRLRASELLLPFGDQSTGLRQELRLCDGLFDYLTGNHVDMSSLDRTGAEISVPSEVTCPPQLSEQEFDRLCETLREGQLVGLGIWGPRRNGAEELVLALATATSRPLRRLLLPTSDLAAEVASALHRQLKIASAHRALVWFDTDLLVDVPREKVSQVLSHELAHSPVPILLTGEQPWRPEALLRTGAYAEIELSEAIYLHREQVWSRNFPELEQKEIEKLAAKYRLASADVRSVAHLARTQARLAGNGVPDPVRNHVAAACSVVTRRSTSSFSVTVVPKRGVADLILAEPLYRQILEVARFFHLQSRVDEDWGFGRLVGASGMRALFTGEPGTGKTLSAEVIAGILGLSLYKVDLARTVSKWVGETEKNLDAAFREAEESHSVLFFDEAEALFGKRGEVQSGTDRYANLEVSYLLQRLEASRGMVILASNVRDQIDAAFIRRFQVVVHFPRPAEPERLRLWKLAFPSSAPLQTELDLATLARLDMTGAAIVNAARNAALFAADAGSHWITMAQVIQAVARQYHREARVLSPSVLGTYGSLLQGVT